MLVPRSENIFSSGNYFIYKFAAKHFIKISYLFSIIHFQRSCSIQMC